MNRIAKAFLITAIVYGLMGMVLGLEMAITHDHSQRPTHAHVMVIGWLSFFAFGFFYLQFGKAVSRILALVHFWMAQAGFLGIFVGLALIYSGRAQYEAIAAVSAIGYALSFLVFGVVAIPVLWAHKE